MNNIINYNCLSIKNKQNNTLQCMNKKKKNCEYCGKHMNSKNIISYKDIYDSYHNKKPKLEDNIHIDKESISIKKQILSKDDLFNNIQNNIIMDVYTIRTSLKNSYLRDIINTKQSKSLLIYHLKKHIEKERYFINNTFKIIKIQSYIRKWIVLRRSKCINDDDILGMINKYEIPSIYFYPFYDEIRRKYYAYDIRSLYELIHSNYSSCPYTLRLFNNNEKESIENYVLKLKTYGISVKEDLIMDDNIELEMKIKELFYDINMLDNYTNHKWFIDLNLHQLIELYIKAEDIWNYRAMLSYEAKRNIVGDSTIFQYSVQIIKHEKSIVLMRKILLNYFNIMISNGIDINEKKLGAILILSALVEVSQDAFEAMPHLGQI